MWSLEALFLYRVVREKSNEQLVAAGYDGRGFLGAAEATQGGRFTITTVVNLYVVISAFKMGLHVDLIEGLTQKTTQGVRTDRKGLLAEQDGGQDNLHC